MSGSCQQLTFDVPEDLKDAVIGELSDCGASGIWESGEPLPGITRLEVYFDSTVDLISVQLCLQTVFSRVNLALPQIEAGTVEDRDWLGEWKKSYVSFPIGAGFFVIPSWSDSICPPDRLPILIDPGQAFGTGTHETTQLTLESLETMVGRFDLSARILDLGTGSGILAIAAWLLGFRNIAGCDNDPDSVRVAVENIERNLPAPASVEAFCGSIDGVPSESVALLLCNLTADVIIHLFPEIDRAMRAGGMAILSGILAEQRGQIRDVLTAAGWVVEDDHTRGEWIALVTQKPG